MTDEKQNTLPENPEEKPKREVKHEINSISDLIQILGNDEIEIKENKQKIIKGLGEPESGKTRFFRGHADESWELLPGIYRKDQEYLLENEDKIIRDALTYCPNDFLPSDTHFEKLVKLQHYGYNTRLLDLTTNALVALFFVIRYDKHDTKNGELVILDIPNSEIKYSDSDTVSILSAIALQENNFILKTEEVIKSAAKELGNEITENNIDKIWDKIKDIYFIEPLQKNKEMRNTLQDIKNEILSPKENGYNPFNSFFKIVDNVKKLFNEQKQITKLLQDIRTDKPSFLSVIDYRDFNRVLCVRAKLNNARISRQQGCFLLFGINGQKRIPALIPESINGISWQQKSSDAKKFIVPYDSKKNIRKELKSFGISERTLFPELEAQAKEIMDYYKGQK